MASPRLKLAKGPLLTPPERVVISERTCAGAGQSGTIQSLFTREHCEEVLHVARERCRPLYRET